MKSNQILKKIALLASGIAVFALTNATAVDSVDSTGNETSIVNEYECANPDALCPNGQPRGTRSADCTIGNNGRGGKGGQGNCSMGNGGKGRGGKGNGQGRKGMGPGNGLGDGTGTGDDSCLQSPSSTAEG